MRSVYPDYYGAFACIKGACRHSCCIGWEIDVDGDSLDRYDGETGELGEKLRRCISREDTPHFILSEDERCPFLTGDGLCELILARGEDALCDICREHPRFHNELPGRVESGLGLCCEAAAALILGRKEPMRLVGAEGVPETDEVILLRDEVLALLQDRAKPLRRRVSEMLALCGASVTERTSAEWAELLLSLERLDDKWTDLLYALRESLQTLTVGGLGEVPYETEYEQLLVYFVYRYLASAETEREIAESAALAAFSFELLCALGRDIAGRTGKLDFADRVELARLYSSEIEYSEENLSALKAALLVDAGS